MKNKLTRLLIISLTLFSVQVFGAVHPELKAFPLANEGMERFVIVLPHKARGEDEDFRVELMSGKVMPTDGINLTRIGTSISSHPLRGWGYIYYEVTGSDVVGSTMMAAPEGQQKINKFVQGDSVYIRYNSRLPIVIYVPKEYGVRYRIWNANVIQQATKR